MKTSNKSSLITGIVLLLIAALFSISLILQPLDFGVSGPGHNNIFYLLGNMLYSVYGFSSILIPGFLLIAGLSCFAAKWTARKTMRLLTALVPFFTCVVTENICRSILALGHDSFAGVKMTVAIITGAMLVVIEWLGVGIIADKLNKKSSRPSLKKFEGFKKPDTESEADYEDKSSVFDEALSEVAPKSDSDEIDEIAEDDEPESDEAENSDDREIDDDKTEAPSAPLLTQEEYAALTTPEEDLGWNLPPAPEVLPPEYDEDFDENDPALEFPPKEEDETVAVEESLPEAEYIDVDEPDDSDKPAEDSADDEIITDEETAPAFDVNFADDEEDEEIEEKKTSEAYDLASPITAAPVFENNEDDDFIEWPEDSDAENDPVVIEENAEESPYSTARYIDSVVENPKFPHGIIIHDDNEEEEDDEDSERPLPVKPKFPSKIKIQSSPEPERDDYFEDNYIEDETLPFPNFDIEEPAYRPNETEEIEEEEDSPLSMPEESPAVQTQTEETETQVQSPVQNQQYYKPLPSAIPVTNPRETEEKPKSSGISYAASSVFSDMENEIREKQAANQRSVQAKSVQSNPVQSGQPLATDAGSPVPPAADSAPEVDFEGKVIEHDSTPSLEGGATNLTADELTDFFNAQQDEIAVRPERPEKKGPYFIPSDLLIAYKDDQYWVIDDATKQAAMNLKQTLAEFNIEAEITGIKKGPVVTMFEILPAPGVKLSKIVALQDNIALSLAAQSVRIVAPIPGKQAVGIEVPNRHRSVVGFREIIEMDLPEWNKMAVPVILGKDILGKAQLIDLVKTPHMLIAGATGSGKSVCVNSLILSILYKRSYHDVKLILVDPKVVELKLYNNIPHLLTPVITEPKKALQALQYCLYEMERRYALLDGMGVRDISNYNTKIKEQNICAEKLPYIVVIIDEFADLMATSGKELENIVARLTAMSRAVGIHLVLATQRPSVNVITGLIKANIPTRIAFMVASRTDSNIIIDTVGAEKLLGRGDMLYASAVDPAPIRIQGTFVSDQEVEDVVNAVKEYGEPDYIDDEIFVDDEEEDGSGGLFGSPAEGDDPLYDQALEIVVQSGKASASYLQRRLKIGYNRAARLVEEMEERGIVGPQNGAKPREIIHVP